MLDFKNKLAFITGGASGAGFGQAQVFGESGAKIVIADIRRDALDEAVNQLRKEGIEAHGMQLDITDREAYRKAADEVEELFGGPPQLLFNTAGVNSFGPTEKLTYEDFDWIFAVNLHGTINGIQSFLPRMIASEREGHIVSTASMGGFQGNSTSAPYCAAKSAVISLMESYSASLKRYGIGVSVLCPASIKSNIAESQDTRPAEFSKNSGFHSDEEFTDLLRWVYNKGMEPVELAKHLKRGIEEDQLYVLPFTETKDGLRAHFEEILDAFPTSLEDDQQAKQRAQDFETYREEAARLSSRI